MKSFALCCFLVLAGQGCGSGSTASTVQNADAKQAVELQKQRQEEQSKKQQEMQKQQQEQMQRAMKPGAGS